MKMNLPNLLTLLRILLIPILVLAFYLPVSGNRWACAIIFAVAALTDWLDGFLARSLKQTSKFGEFLDPIADKLIVAVALVLLVADDNLPFLTIPAAIIIGREIVISGLREWMSEIGSRASVAVSMMGKYKTLAQMVALTFLLGYKPGVFWLIPAMGYILLYASAILTLWSMTVYLKAAWPDLTFKQK